MKRCFLSLLALLIAGSLCSAKLVAHFDFEEGSGDVALDGALDDGTATPDDSGYIDGATHLPGVVGNYALHIGKYESVELEANDGAGDILTSAPAATFAAWVKLDVHPSDIGTIVFISTPTSSANSRGGLFVQSDGAVEVGGRAADSDWFQSRVSSTTLPLKEFNHRA